MERIVVRRDGNKPPRLVRKLRRASTVAPKPTHDDDDDYDDLALKAENERLVEEFDVITLPLSPCFD